MSNSRQCASKRALYSGLATAREGAITATRKRARMSGSTTDISRKASNPSTSMMDQVTNEEIDPNVCCMCFITFEEDTCEGTGVKWLPCHCGRWLNKDCAKECIADSDGMSITVHFVLIFYHYNSC